MVNSEERLSFVAKGPSPLNETTGLIVTAQLLGGEVRVRVRFS